MTLRQGLLRRLYRWAHRIDERDPLWSSWIPTAWKRWLVRRFFRRGDLLLQHEVAELDGLRLTMPEALRTTFVLQHHEPGTRRLLEAVLRPGMTVVDVGANIGYHALLAARRVGEGGRVLAVEPSAVNLEHLRANVERNALPWVRVLPVAAGAQRGRRSFHHRADSGHSGLFPHPREATMEVEEVEEAPLDELISGPVDLVKIDVEGGEVEVLRGMERILEENPRIRLLVEWSPQLLTAAGREPGALEAELRRHGFALWRVDEEVAERGEGLPLEPFDAEAVDPGTEHNLYGERPGSVPGSKLAT